MKTLLIGLLFTLGAAFHSTAGESTPSSKDTDVTKIPVVFSGGHDTNPADHGRPVQLIAAALGVSSEVFREAFSRVRPAHTDQGPTPEEARMNKAALMDALEKYGITNERLDEVSNYYRYRPEHHELWKHRPATANALIKDGVITGYEITDAGAGYTTPPTVSVPGFKDEHPQVELSFGKDLASNGSIARMTPKTAPPTN